MTTEELYQYADNRNIEVDWFIFAHADSLSAPIGDEYIIAIDPTKIKSHADEKAKLGHELGHCETHSFYSPYDDYYTRQRYENRADKWAIKKLIPKDELDAAIENGFTEIWQLSELFEVPDEFMMKAVHWYKSGKLSL